MEDLTTALYGIAEQGRSIQALHHRRIWENALAAPNGSCLKNVLEEK